jgi:hypothetical protein
MRVPTSEQKPEQYPLRAAPLMQPQAFRSVIRIIPTALLTLAHAPCCRSRRRDQCNAAAGHGVAQRRNHWIRLPTYQPAMLAIRKMIAIDGTAATGLS